MNDMMTPADLKAWQKAMGYTYESASDSLGMSRSGYAKLVAGTAKIDRRTELACAAIAAGIKPWTSGSVLASEVPTVRLYAFKPKGHGELSFFVIAESEEQAKQYLNVEITEKSKLDRDDPLHLPHYYYAGWGTDYYELTVTEVGEVIVNNND